MNRWVGNGSSGLAGLTSSTAITYDMIVHDAEYLGSAKEYCKIGDELENCVERYLKIMRDVSELCKGEFSDSLKNFSDIVELLMTSSAKESLNALGKHMKTYIDELDSADGNWN